MIWRPRPLSTTDNPQRVNPGSTPITRTPSSLDAERLFDTLAGRTDMSGYDTRVKGHEQSHRP